MAAGMSYLARIHEEAVLDALRFFPVTALVGAGRWRKTSKSCRSIG
jgi:hypothetical protein